MKKKIFSFLLAICLIIPAMFALTACGDKEPPHTHAYNKVSYVVENDKAYKVKTCNCEEFTKTEIQGALIATPQNINDVIVNATDNSTIVLSAGDYGVINMHSSLENVSILGTTVTVEKIDIAGHTNANITIDSVTFDGTADWSGVYVGSIGLDGLTVRNCSFVNNSYVLGGGSEDDHISIINLLVENCSFDMTNMENKEGVQLSAINIWGSNGVTIKNNSFKNADYNAIQLAGEINGAVVIEENIIDGTGSRALRLNNVNARVKIKNNSIKNVQEGDEQVLKATSVTAEGSIIFENNTYAGNAWNPENVIAPATNVVYTIDLN